MFRQTYTYADIGLVPTWASEVTSRSDIDMRVPIFKEVYNLPIMNAPMATVVTIDMINKLAKAGALTCLDRTSKDINVDVRRYLELDVAAEDTTFLSLGLDYFAVNALTIFDMYGISRFCLDVANGYHTGVLDAIEAVKQSQPNIKIMAGNIASVEGWRALAGVGADAIRVGIGGGAGCSTSIATGVGVGQASLIREIAALKIDTYPYLIADGGIREVGDICKALALGADFVMLGSMLAGTNEAGGEIVMVRDVPMKRFAGQASELIKGTNRYVEGVSTMYPLKGPVQNVLRQIDDGLRSCVSYMGGNTLMGLHNLKDESFCLLSSNARAERTPHSREIR